MSFVLEMSLITTSPWFNGDAPHHISCNNRSVTLLFGPAHCGSITVILSHYTQLMNLYNALLHEYLHLNQLPGADTIILLSTSSQYIYILYYLQQSRQCQFNFTEGDSVHKPAVSVSDYTVPS